MRFGKGDWVLIGNGKKAHKLIQGYNTPVPRCTPNWHLAGMTGCYEVEQEDMKDPGDSAKCKRCLKV